MENPPTMSDNGILAHYSALPAVEGAGVQTTIDISTRKGQVELSQALCGESNRLWAIEDERVFRVTHLVAHYAEREDENTGEIIRGPLLTLLGPDGAFYTFSKWAFRDLQMIASLRGRPPWNPPLVLKPVHARCGNGHIRQAIVLAE